MKQGSRFPSWIYATAVTGLFLLIAGAAAGAQDAPPKPAPSPDSMADAVHDLQVQVRELRAVVTEMRADAAQYRAETENLRRELEATRNQVAAAGIGQTPAEAVVSSTSPTASEGRAQAAKDHANSLEDRVASLEESSQLLSGKVDEQYQTKVESASKYRMRLSGMVLMNLFSNRGATDNQDFPSYAVQAAPYYSNGNVGATLRQSEIGLEVFGPRLAGARTSANVQADFAGGFPNTMNGVDSGIFRLRTASLRLDWQDTSVVVGQDNLFLAPLAPTSFASVAVPAFSYAGNLWGWIPQVRVEHRFSLSPGQTVALQAGIVDNLTGEPPYSPYGRLPEAGESSGQPGYGMRVAWTGDIFDRPLTIGTSGYYSRQDWGFDRRENGWASMTDWDVPLTQWASLSGEFYRGRAIGGLGAGIGRSVLFSGNPLDPTAQILGLNSIGGWSQLKIKASSKLEFNGAFGIDNPFAGDIRAFPEAESYLDPGLVRNRGSLINFVYRPRSDLLFSTEYRRLRTFDIDNTNYPAGQVNLVMGILF